MIIGYKGTAVFMKILSFTMSFSHYKTLLQWAQISSRNIKCNPEILRRLYSNNVIFSSASPHKLKVNPRKLKVTTHDKSNKSITHEKSNKLDKNKMFQAKLRSKKLPYKPEEKFIQITDLDNQDENLEGITEEIEISEEKPQTAAKVNMRLINHPHYKQTMSKHYEKQNIKADHDSNIVNLKSLSVEETNDGSKSEKYDKDRYQISHLTPVESENFDSSSFKKNKVTARSKNIETIKGTIKYDLSTDEFNTDKYVKELMNTKPLDPLDECKDDISDFGPGLVPTFNFAAYADKSPLIQEYVKLGVKLYKVEKNLDHMRALLTIDLETELPVYLQFLHDCGVPASSLGDVITENSMILKEDLDDLKTRIRYLRAHEFDVESIARIVTKNPTWLTWATKHIDERLGHFQNEFKLTGSELRFLATKQPKLITYNFKSIHENTFALREEMGFNRDEIKVLLLSKPRLWMNTRKKIVDSFDYLHNIMKLSHVTIASQADLLTCRKSRLKSRHEFLVELKKDQYDPKKPGYIAPKHLAFGSDEEFCRDVAKAALETYNLFLKTC